MEGRMWMARVYICRLLDVTPHLTCRCIMRCRQLIGALCKEREPHSHTNICQPAHHNNNEVAMIHVETMYLEIGFMDDRI